VEESSTIEFQEQFQEDLDLASRRNRYWTANLQRSFGPTLVQLQADSTDTFFFDPDTINPESFDRRRHLPAVIVSQSPKRFRRTGLVFSYDARGEGLQLGNQDRIDTYNRFDLNPRLSRPLSRSFLQLTPQLQARYTRYGARVEENELVSTPIERRYLEGSLEMRGPSFSRVFNTPGNFYSDRFKHVFTPEVTYTYRSKFEEFEQVPRFDYLDFFPGTNEVPEPYEFLMWRVNQTYYVDIATKQNQFDPNYSSAVFGKSGEAAHLSPLQSRLRIRPTPRISTNFDIEYDVNFRELRSLSVSTSVNYDRLGFDARLYRGQYRITLDRVRPVNTVRGSGRLQLVPGKLTAAGSVDYNVIDKSLVQATARLRYDVQCCGFVAEMIKSKYNIKDRQFRFAIELANIGSIGNFMGQEANASNRGFLSR
jgi:hypothetical protein